MASTEYAPGTVAVATVRGVEGVRVFRTFSREGDGGIWRHAKVNGSWVSHDDRVTDVRPLVVLDLADYSGERAVNYLRNLAQESRDVMGNTPSPRGKLALYIAYQIEAQTKPPRIPEPTECGATVIAAQTGEIEGSDRLWVRFRHGSKNCWIDQNEHVRSWGDLDNPRTTECEGES